MYIILQSKVRKLPENLVYTLFLTLFCPKIVRMKIISHCVRPQMFHVYNARRFSDATWYFIRTIEELTTLLDVIFTQFIHHIWIYFFVMEKTTKVVLPFYQSSKPFTKIWRGNSSTAEDISSHRNHDWLHKTR